MVSTENTFILVGLLSLIIIIIFVVSLSERYEQQMMIEAVKNKCNITNTSTKTTITCNGEQHVTNK